MGYAGDQWKQPGTHAVHLLGTGANTKYVSERLGHASVKVTADTYLHVTKKIEEDTLTHYANYLTPKKGAKSEQTTFS